MPARVAMLSDIPAKTDKLGFARYVEVLSHIILEPETQTPLTIGIFGTWGTGKTSLMGQIKDRLEEEAPAQAQTVWFNAWKQREGDLWRPLLLHVLDAVLGLLPPDKEETWREIQSMQDLLYRISYQPEAGQFSASFRNLEKRSPSTEVGLTLGIGDGLRIGRELIQTRSLGSDRENIGIKFAELGAREIQTARERTRSIQEFHEVFGAFVNRYLSREEQRLVVFVDDLDRCPKEKATTALEAINLFLDVPGCVFILAIDAEAIQSSIQSVYDVDEEKATEYLQKMIQIPFILPPIEPGAMLGYILSLVPKHKWPKESGGELCPHLSFARSGWRPAAKPLASGPDIVNQLRPIVTETTILTEQDECRVNQAT